MLTTAVIYVFHGQLRNAIVICCQSGMFVMIKCAYRMWRILKVSCAQTEHTVRRKLSTCSFVKLSSLKNYRVRQIIDITCKLFSARQPAPPPQWARVRPSSLTRFLDHTQRCITVGRTPLDEWSARRRDLYLTTHNTHNRQTSMPWVGFEPTISAGERPQTGNVEVTHTKSAER
jgi:hypothetical protein